MSVGASWPRPISSAALGVSRVNPPSHRSNPFGLQTPEWGSFPFFLRYSGRDFSVDCSLMLCLVSFLPRLWSSMKWFS